jgi:hypothetical protein
MSDRLVAIADAALLLRVAERRRDALTRETPTAQANEIAHRCSHYRAELDRLLSEYFA